MEFMTIEDPITGLEDKGGSKPPVKKEKTDPPEVKQTKRMEDDNNDIIDFGNQNIDPDKSRGSGTPSSSDNIYINLAKSLKDSGVLSEFDDKVFSKEDSDPAEALISLLKGSVDSNIDEFKSQFSDDKLQALLALERGESIDEFLKIKNEALSLDKITEDELTSDDNSSLRKQIISDFYKETTNFSDARINKNIQRMIDTGEDIEESVNILTELKGARAKKAKSKLDEQAAAATKRQRDYDNKINALKEEVDSIDLGFLGITENKKVRNKIFDMLTKPISATENINAVQKKRNELGDTKFDIILSSLIERGVFDGDLTKLSKKQRSSAMDELRNSVERSSYATGRGGSFSDSKGSPDSIFSRRR